MVMDQSFPPAHGNSLKIASSPCLFDCVFPRALALSLSRRLTPGSHEETSSPIGREREGWKKWVFHSFVGGPGGGVGAAVFRVRQEGGKFSSYVPISQEVRYFFWASVNSSMRIPMDFNFKWAISWSISLGTPYTFFSNFPLDFTRKAEARA